MGRAGGGRGRGGASFADGASSAEPRVGPKPAATGARPLIYGSQEPTPPRRNTSYHCPVLSGQRDSPCPPRQSSAVTWWPTSSCGAYAGRPLSLEVHDPGRRASGRTQRPSLGEGEGQTFVSGPRAWVFTRRRNPAQENFRGKRPVVVQPTRKTGRTTRVSA